MPLKPHNGRPRRATILAGTLGTFPLELFLQPSPLQTGSGRKKVLVRKFSRDVHSGYATPSSFAHNGVLELIDQSGKVLTLEADTVKTFCFVREFLQGEDPERLARRVFAGRPRTPGLWVRLRFRDGDEMEGLVNNDLSLLDPEGIQFTPPDLRSNTQRVFVPRTALTALEILAVIRPPSAPRRKAAEQERLFAE
jgi:hypothetical protein